MVKGFLGHSSKPRIKRDAFLYLGDTGGDHQCGTCCFLSGKLCTIGDFLVEAEWTCCYAIDGPPSKCISEPYLTAEEMGLYKGKVRCENCRYGGVKCTLYMKLNREFPNDFDLEEKIEPKGCCNAFEPAESDR